LQPLAWPYRAGLAASRAGARPVRVGRPVIAVGNLTVGGSGKTPLVIELVGLLGGLGARVAVLSRGWGRASRGTRVVRVPGTAAIDVRSAGDEPALIATRCPAAAVVVGEDRVDAARLAIETWRPDVLVCDDAFQHRRLARDRDLLAVHARRGLGNRRLLPAGPLREPPAAASRADWLVFSHAGDAEPEALRRRHRLVSGPAAAACDFAPAGLVRTAQLRPWEGELPGRVVAACGVADPTGFGSALQRFGLEVVELLALADHRPLGPRRLARLAERVRRVEADALVVTEKDLIKVAQPPPGLRLAALRLEARWPAGSGRRRLAADLERLLGGGRGG
jgi:tetraacyldisaccharide 4'-kinase